jgi:hypothetical protein
MQPRVDCPGLSDWAKKALLVESASQVKPVVLGATVESDTLRYVVIAHDFGLRPSRRDASGDYHLSISPGAMTMRKVGDKWRIEPVFDLAQATGMGGMTTFAITCERDSTKAPAKSK